MPFNSSDVTIIIPVYCTSDESLQWLDECLASATTQGAKVIVYNDGSTVNIEPILQKYILVNIGDRLNNGVSYARNMAASKVTTELILPLDCDDTLKPDAVAKLVKRWDGIPVYPDVAKFGSEVEEHYVLLDFSCEHIINYIGFTSVNVLHSLQQHNWIGGWDETLDFYEDGEYNARLLGTYCGIHLREPLVNYRIHANQRTKTYAAKAHDYGVKILKEVRKRDMACKGCGGRRSPSLNLPGVKGALKAVGNNAPVNLKVAGVVDAVNLPLEMNGMFLAQYVGGKGRGSHYYNGLATRHPYRVKFEAYVYAYPADITPASFFVRIAAPAAPEAPEAKPTEVRKPVKTVERKAAK